MRDSLKQHFVNEMQYLPQVIIKTENQKNYLLSSFMMGKDVNELIDLGKNYPAL